jgi:hypothetical protein
MIGAQLSERHTNIALKKQWNYSIETADQKQRIKKTADQKTAN